MNAISQAVQPITSVLASLPTDPYGGLSAGVLAQAFEGWEHLGTPGQILGDQPPDVDVEPHPLVLGSYRPLASPGIVTLLAGNLQRFYWSIVKEMTLRLPGFPFPRQDLEFLAAFVVEATWHHEVFHHSMEVIRRLTAGQPYAPTEESLAVAYSRQCLRQSKWNSNIGRLGRVMYNLAMELAFDGYRAPYDQWPLFDSPERLQQGIVDLVKPSEQPLLTSSGVSVSGLIWRLIPVHDGFVERCV